VRFGGIFKKLKHLAKNKIIRKIAGKVAPHLIGMVPGGSTVMKARDIYLKHRGRVRRVGKLLHHVHTVRGVTQKVRAARHSHLVHPPHIQSHRNRAISQMPVNPFLSGRFNHTHWRRLLAMKGFRHLRGKRGIALRARMLKAV